MPSPFRSGYYPILDEDTDVITSGAARSSDSIPPFPYPPFPLEPYNFITWPFGSQ